MKSRLFNIFFRQKGHSGFTLCVQRAPFVKRSSKFPVVFFLLLFVHQYCFSQQIDFTTGYTGALGQHYSVNNDMAITSDSSLVLTGGYWYHNGISFFHLIKADMSGNIKWIAKDDTTGMSVGEGFIVSELSNGNYLIVERAVITIGSVDLHIVIYDSSGAFINQKLISYLPDTSLSVTDFIEINQSLYFVCAYNDHLQNSGCAVIKTDLGGNLLDEFWIPDHYPGNRHAALTNEDDHIFFAGGVWDTIQFQSNVQLTAIDTNANILWEKTYAVSGVGQEICRSDSGFLLSTSDANYLLKTDSMGNFLWSEYLNASNFRENNVNYFGNILLTTEGPNLKWLNPGGQLLSSYSYSGIVTGDYIARTINIHDKIYVCGASYNGSDSFIDFLIRFTDSSLVSVGDMDIASTAGFLYPNPVQSGRRVYYSIPGEIEDASIYTIDGKRITILQSAAGPSGYIDLPADIDNGIYVVSFKSGNGRRSFRVTIVN